MDGEDPATLSQEEDEESFFMRVGLILLLVGIVLLVIFVFGLIICLYRKYKYRPNVVAIFKRPIQVKGGLPPHTFRPERQQVVAKSSSNTSLLPRHESDHRKKTKQWLETHVDPIPVYTPHSLVFGAVVDRPSPAASPVVQRRAEPEIQEDPLPTVNKEEELVLKPRTQEVLVVEPTHLFQYYVRTKEGKARFARKHFEPGHMSLPKTEKMSKGSSAPSMPLWRSLLAQKAKKSSTSQRGDLLMRTGSTRARHLHVSDVPRDNVSDPGILRSSTRSRPTTSPQISRARLSHLELRPNTTKRIVPQIPLRSNLKSNTTHAYTLQGGTDHVHSQGYSVDRPVHNQPIAAQPPHWSAANTGGHWTSGNVQQPYSYGTSASLLGSYAPVPNHSTQWGMSQNRPQGEFAITGRNVTVTY